MHSRTHKPSLWSKAISSAVPSTALLAALLSFGGRASAQKPVQIKSAPGEAVVMSVDQNTGVPVVQFLKVIQRLHGGRFVFDARELAGLPPVSWDGGITVEKGSILRFADERLRAIGLRLDYSPSLDLHTVGVNEEPPARILKDRVFKLRYGDARSIAQTLTQFLGQQEHSVRIVGDAGSNRIVVRAEAETLVRIERLILDLDFPATPEWKPRQAFDCRKEDGKYVLRIYDHGATTVGALLDTAAEVLDRGIYYDPLAAADAGRITFAGKLVAEPDAFLPLVRRLLYTRGYLLVERGRGPEPTLEAVSLRRAGTTAFLHLARTVALKDVEGLRDQIGLPIRTIAYLPEGGAGSLVRHLEPQRRRIAPRDFAVHVHPSADDEKITITGLAPEVAAYMALLRLYGAVGTPPEEGDKSDREDLE